MIFFFQDTNDARRFLYMYLWINANQILHVWALLSDLELSMIDEKDKETG